METTFQFTTEEMLEIIKRVNQLNTKKPKETREIIEKLLQGGGQ